jgi:F0F1-type ATP synthase membrane subunit a
MFLAQVVFVQLPANICYTGGWVVELIAGASKDRMDRRFGPYALVAGTLFSFVAIAVWAYLLGYFSG